MSLFNHFQTVNPGKPTGTVPIWPSIAISIWILLVQLFTVGCGGHKTGAAPPTIDDFQPAQRSVKTGELVRLEAKFSAGTGRVDPGGHLLAESGQLWVNPIGTTIYTLTVTNPDGTAIQRQTTVEVKPGLILTIEGDQGVTGVVTVTGPGAFQQNVYHSETLADLQPGNYTVTAAPAEGPNGLLHPWKPTQHLRVDTGVAVKVHYPAPSLSIPLPGDVQLELVLIPAGSFVMGDDHPADPWKLPSPSPAHPVTIAQAFYLAKYPTTREQWGALVKADSTEPWDNPPNASPWSSPKDPATQVSYEDIIMRYIPILNTIQTDYHFRLPSEAEWEYAYRAGTTTQYFYGESALQGVDFAWTLDEFFSKKDHPVGGKQPNPWGLYDLTGLVFQWCEDLFHESYLPGIDQRPDHGQPWIGTPHSIKSRDRIIRGYGPIIATGSNHYGRAADRWSMAQESKQTDVGFRLFAIHRDLKNSF